MLLLLFDLHPIATLMTEKAGAYKSLLSFHFNFPDFFYQVQIFLWHTNLEPSVYQLKDVGLKADHGVENLKDAELKPSDHETEKLDVASAGT